MIKRILITSLITLFSLLIFGQEEPDTRNIGLVLISKHQGQTVSLRWAPSSPMAWEKANIHGWWVERVLIPSKTEPGDTSYQLITSQPIKPLPLEAWEIPSDTSDAAAIAAQVLYGETLDITNASSAMTLIDKNKELETRFAFALTAAEQDFTVAQMMGLGLIDKNVIPNRTYIYRVYANISDSLFVADTAGVVVNLREKYELPRVFDVKAEVRDSTITLQWPAGYHRGIYSTYRVEKSIEGKTYKAVNDLPLANMFSGGQSDFNHYFTDHHTADGETLYYRVRGITPFGDFGPPSDSVKAVIPLIFPIPSNLKYSEIPDGDIAITWEFPDEFTDKVLLFDVIGSASFKGNPISLGKQESTLRRAVIKSPSSEMYISLVAVGKDGTSRNSHPIMIQLSDSIPPLPPKNLYGSIDKSGTAQIGWQWGSEFDLFGYRVYAAANPKAEFTLLTSEFERDSTYSWNVPLNTLSRKLYVKVMAYDYRYNYSIFSEILNLTLPDTIPPSAPVLKTCERTAEGVKFKWIPSGSEDVESHAIIYISTEDNQQDTIVTIQNNQTEFTWENPAEGTWNFVVSAIDSSGNSAHSTQHFRLNLKGIEFTNFSPKLSVNRNMAEGKIELSWSTHPSSTKAIVYRSVNGEPFRIYNTLNGSMFIDGDVTVGYSYAYIVRLENQSEMLSMYSEEVKISY